MAPFVFIHLLMDNVPLLPVIIPLDPLYFKHFDGRIRGIRLYFLRCNMGIAGIITEYNPLHQGHQFHIEETRRTTGASHIIAVMSGDYVQRGVPSIFDKYQRTKMALAAGADLVAELPVSHAAASAEYFAQGGIQLLDSMGIITDLCFGSEAGNLSPFLSTAKLLEEEPPAYQTHLRSRLREGLSFPAARREGLLSFWMENGLPEGCADFSDMRAFLETPNNILGLEYCRALLRQGSSIRPHTILRQGNGYHETALPQDCRRFTSASALRTAICARTPFADLEAFIPQPARPIFLESLDTFADADDFSLLLHMRLLQEDAQSLTAYQDVSRELANRIVNCRGQYRTFSQFSSLLKTKEVTYTRIQRALLHILLEIKRPPDISYIRILGVRKESRSLLSLLQKHSRLPVFVTVSKALNQLEGDALEDLKQEIYVSDLYESVLCGKYSREFQPECSRPLIVL